MMLSAGVLDEKKAYDRGAKRREKSRDAARCRRQQESETFNEICKAIPVPTKQLAQMDRSTVMRLLISFMKLRNITNSEEFQLHNEIKREVSQELPSDGEYINALNGFIIVLSHDSDILYISTNVKQYIGIPSLDLIGQNLFGFTHEGDHAEITNCLKAPTEERENHSFFMRMKSTLTSSGKNVNLKSASYKVLKCEGVVRCSSSSAKQESDGLYMVAYCEPIPHPANIEMVLDSNTFLSQHSLDMKFTYCDGDRTSSLMGYSKDDMVGESFYNFCHAEDVKLLDDAMRKLFRLGQVTTNQYRMLAKFGGFVTVISQATIINNPRNQQPSYVVCVNYVISGVINGNRIMSLPQTRCTQPDMSEIIKQEIDDIPDDEPGPLDCTESIFCDSTNLTFCDVGVGDESDLPFADDATTKVFIPFTESMEVMAKNAPSIGDEVDFSQFTEILGVVDEELCNNAPSIGDPQCSASLMPPSHEGGKNMSPSVNVDRVKGYLKEEYATNGYGSPQMSMLPYQPSLLKTNTMQNEDRPSPHYPTLLTAAPPMPMCSGKRKIPTGSFQVVTIPKNQYQRHMQHQGGSFGNTYKVDPPDVDDPPTKKSRCQAVFGRVSDPWYHRPYADQINSSGTAEVLLNGKYTRGDAGSLASFLLQPGNKCDNPEPPMGPREPSRDRDPSWSRARIAENGSLLPVLSLHDCEVNAPVDENLSTVDWMTLSSALRV